MVYNWLATVLQERSYVMFILINSACSFINAMYVHRGVTASQSVGMFTGSPMTIIKTDNNGQLAPPSIFVCEVIVTHASCTHPYVGCKVAFELYCRSS